MKLFHMRRCQFSKQLSFEWRQRTRPQVCQLICSGAMNNTVPMFSFRVGSHLLTLYLALKPKSIIFNCVQSSDTIPRPKIRGVKNCLTVFGSKFYLLGRLIVLGIQLRNRGQNYVFWLYVSVYVVDVMYRYQSFKHILYYYRDFFFLKKGLFQVKSF